MNLLGQKFGRLLVTSFFGKANDGHYVWTCECDCGNFGQFRGSHLKTGQTLSCGCTSQELKQNLRDPDFLDILDNYDKERRDSPVSVAKLIKCNHKVEPPRPCRECLLKAYEENSQALDRLYMIYNEIYDRFASKTLSRRQIFMEVELKYNFKELLND